jgi:hypothetical protein
VAALPAASAQSRADGVAEIPEWVAPDALPRAIEEACDPIAHARERRGGASADLAGECIALAIAIDVSGSTAEPTGVDVDGDGEIGEGRLSRVSGDLLLHTTDPGDSIFFAQLAGVRSALEALALLEPTIAIVTFSGEPPDFRPSLFGRKRKRPPDARILIGPTSAYDSLYEALEDVLAEGPHGATNYAAGLEQSLGALRGIPERETCTRDIVFLSDGVPTFPFDPSKQTENVHVAVEAAEAAHGEGIVVHALGINPRSEGGPALEAMAEAAGGRYVELVDPTRLACEIVDSVLSESR